MRHRIDRLLWRCLRRPRGAAAVILTLVAALQAVTPVLIVIHAPLAVSALVDVALLCLALNVIGSWQRYLLWHNRRRYRAGRGHW